MFSGGFEPPILLKLCVNACIGSERASSLHEDFSTYFRASVNVKVPGVTRKTIFTQNKKTPTKAQVPRVGSKDRLSLELTSAWKLDGSE
jgi:hypothetical protein